MNDSVVSIRKSIDDLDKHQQLAVSALRMLASLVNEIDKNVVRPSWPEKWAQPELPQLAAALKAASAPDELAPAQGRVVETLGTCEGLIRQYREGAAGIEDCIAVLEKAAEQLSDKGAQRESSLRSAATSLEEVAVDGGNLHSLRERLRLQVAQIVALADEVARENQATVEMLKGEMYVCRQRLNQAETEALTDPLTRLGNRRAVEQRIQEFIENGTQFSLILIDLNRFKYINDAHGHLIGDELLKAFAGRLRRNMRGRDLAARWGGDEFVLLMCCSVGDAMRRLQTLQPMLCGRYGLGRDDRALHLHVSASFGIAERKHGEATEDLLRRADKLLYHQKAGGPNPNP